MMFQDHWFLTLKIKQAFATQWDKCDNIPWSLIVIFMSFAES